MSPRSSIRGYGKSVSMKRHSVDDAHDSPSKRAKTTIDGIEIQEFDNELEMEFFTNLQEGVPRRMKPFKGFSDETSRRLNALKNYFDCNKEKFVAAGVRPWEGTVGNALAKDAGVDYESKNKRQSKREIFEATIQVKLPKIKVHPVVPLVGMTIIKPSKSNNAEPKPKALKTNCRDDDDDVIIVSDSDDDVILISDPSVPLPLPQGCVRRHKCPNCGKSRTTSQRPKSSLPTTVTEVVDVESPRVFQESGAPTNPHKPESTVDGPKHDQPNNPRYSPLPQHVRKSETKSDKTSINAAIKTNGLVQNASTDKLSLIAVHTTNEKGIFQQGLSFTRQAEVTRGNPVQKIHPRLAQTTPLKSAQVHTREMALKTPKPKDVVENSDAFSAITTKKGQNGGVGFMADDTRSLPVYLSSNHVVDSKRTNIESLGGKVRSRIPRKSIMAATQNSSAITKDVQLVINQMMDSICLQEQFPHSFQYDYDEERQDDPSSTVLCGEQHCRLGCICISLAKKSVRRVRCNNAECVFGCSCKSHNVVAFNNRKAGTDMKPGKASRRKQVHRVHIDYGSEMSAQTPIKSYLPVQKLAFPKTQESPLEVGTEHAGLLRAVKDTSATQLMNGCYDDSRDQKTCFLVGPQSKDIAKGLDESAPATGTVQSSPLGLSHLSGNRRYYGREKIPIPEQALMCMTPGWGYVPLEQVVPKVVICDPFSAGSRRSFLSIAQATKYLNANLATTLNTTNLMWVVANKSTLEKKQLHRLSIEHLKNPNYVRTVAVKPT